MNELMNLEEAKKINGYLQKKSPSIFGGWQSRYFSITDGRFLIYSDEKGAKAKGVIDLDKAKITSDLDPKIFKISISDREFILKAESEEEKISWVNSLKCLSVLKRKMTMKSKTEKEVLEDDEIPVRVHSKTQNWKIKNIDKDAFSALEKSGQFGENTDFDLSQKMLVVKGIKRHLSSIPLDIIDSRIIYGFLLKRHKSTVEIYQKRWYFLISPRPLKDLLYEKDDFNLEDKILPSFINFDNIYYYIVDNENDSSEAVGNYNLMDCHGIELKDKDSKYFLTLDMGDKKIDMCTEFKGERDKWFEAIKNSRRTSKDYKNSISQNPRNFNKILNIYEKDGLSKIYSLCENEKNKICQNFSEIESFEILEMLINNLKKFLFNTIDGCILMTSPKIEILKIYVDSFNFEILLRVSEFWKKSHTYISNINIISLGSTLYEYEEQLSNYGVIDPNFSQNARELFKIYSKKTFFVIKEFIENIMKSEREIKAVKGSDDILITNSPTDIFKMMYKTLDIIKGKKIKPLFHNFLFLLKESIYIYLVGVEYLLNRNDLDIDKEFLIAISNNSIRITTQLSDMIDDIKSLDVISEKDIENHLKLRDISTLLNSISNLAITRLVSELYAVIIKEFNNQFLQLETDKIIRLTVEVFSRFVSYMHMISQKRLWNEVLNSTLFYYIKSLLTTAGKTIKKIEEVTEKIRYDKQNLVYVFERYLGANAIHENLKIIEDFLDFLETSPEMMSIAFSKLRISHGNAFSFSTAKALINLRVDFSSSDKKETIMTCKEILDKMEIKENTNSKKNKLFDQIDVDMKEFERKEEEELEKKMNEENQFKEKEELTKAKPISLDEFLNGGAQDIVLSPANKDADDESAQDKIEPIFFDIKIEEKIEKDSDIIMSGYLQKKSHSMWQERYFTLKNGLFYWYLNEESREAQNFFSLNDCKKILPYKPNRFMLLIQDKIYKFLLKTDEERDKWINAINNEIKKLRGEVEKKVENYYNVKLKKKIIIDYLNLPPPHSDQNEIRRKIEECISKETYFEKKEAFKSKNNELQPNKDIVNKQPSFKEELPRIKPPEIKKDPTENRDILNTDKSVSALNRGSDLNMRFIQEKPKKEKSIFYHCLRCFKFFRKKKKPYNEFEGQV